MMHPTDWIVVPGVATEDIGQGSNGRDCAPSKKRKVNIKIKIFGPIDFGLIILWLLSSHGPRDGGMTLPCTENTSPKHW